MVLWQLLTVVGSTFVVMFEGCEAHEELRRCTYLFTDFSSWTLSLHSDTSRDGRMRKQEDSTSWPETLSESKRKRIDDHLSRGHERLPVFNGNAPTDEVDH